MWLLLLGLALGGESAAPIPDWNGAASTPDLSEALFQKDGKTLNAEGERVLMEVVAFLRKNPGVQVVILVPARIRRGDPYWWTQQVSVIEQGLMARGLGSERIGVPLQPEGPMPPRQPSPPRPVQGVADLVQLDLVRITLENPAEPEPLAPGSTAPSGIP